MRLLIALFEERQPGTPMILMCMRALDLYDAAAATGDVGLVEQIASFIEQLTKGILKGLSAEKIDFGSPCRLHG